MLDAATTLIAVNIFDASEANTLMEYMLNNSYLLFLAVKAVVIILACLAFWREYARLRHSKWTMWWLGRVILRNNVATVYTLSVLYFYVVANNMLVIVRSWLTLNPGII